MATPKNTFELVLSYVQTGQVLCIRVEMALFKQFNGLSLDPMTIETVKLTTTPGNTTLKELALQALGVVERMCFLVKFPFYDSLAVTKSDRDKINEFIAAWCRMYPDYPLPDNMAVDKDRGNDNGVTESEDENTSDTAPIKVAYYRPVFTILDFKHYHEFGFVKDCHYNKEGQYFVDNFFF